MTQILIQAEADQQKNVTERWKHDMASDNKLTKSVRPMVLIFLILCTMLLIFHQLILGIQSIARQSETE